MVKPYQLPGSFCPNPDKSIKVLSIRPLVEPIGDWFEFIECVMHLRSPYWRPGSARLGGGGVSIASGN